MHASFIERLHAVIYDYGNLENLCHAYDRLATLIANECDDEEEGTSLLLHALNEKLLGCLHELKAIAQQQHEEPA